MKKILYNTGYFFRSIVILLLLCNHINMNLVNDNIIDYKISKHSSMDIISILATTPKIILNNQSGKIEFHVNTNNRFKSVNYYIKPLNPGAQYIQFIFSKLQIMAVEMTVIDEEEIETGIQIFGCNIQSCEYDRLPPPIFSKTGAVYLAATGVASNSWEPSTFTVQYFSNPLEQTSLLNNINIDLNMGYAKISPQLFYGKLLANTTQTWTITKSSSNNSPIMFSFTDFNFSKSICGPVLKIYDRKIAGNLIYYGCLSSDFPDYWIYSYTQEAYVILEAGYKDDYIDFLITFDVDSELFLCGSINQPDVLTDNSMIITDGSFSSTVIKSGITCKWLIQPLESGYVTLFLRWVSLKPGSKVKVYDNNKASGHILWNCEGPTFTVPPPITSTGRSLYVVYTTNTMLPDGYYGFKGEYMNNYANSVGVGSGYTLLSMSSAIDIFPPGDGITTYRNNLDYTWLLQPNMSTGVITFVFSELYLPFSGDELIIYDGMSIHSPILARFKGIITPFEWFKTSNTFATISFKSNNINPNTGNFKLSYFSDGPNYHCGFTTNPAIMNAKSMTFTDGSASHEKIYYNQNCEWSINATDSKGIYLFFTRYNIKGGIVKIYEGSVASGILIATIDETLVIPAPIYVYSTNIVGISYKTGSQESASGFGFSATYYGISDNYIGPGDGLIHLLCTSLISLSIKNGDNDRIIMPFTNITWLINPLDANTNLYFSFSLLNLSSCDYSRGKYLELYDGPSLSSPLIGTYCGTDVPVSWIKTSSSVMLNYVSSGLPFDLTQDFDLSFYSDGPNSHCGFNVNPAILKSKSMIFTDGSSSTDLIYNDQYCEWIISPMTTSNNNRIILEFLVNDLHGANIKVYDGMNATNTTLLWECSNCNVVPRPIIGNSNSMFVVYSTKKLSPSISTGYGFRAIYWSIEKELTSWQDPSLGKLLELPFNYEMESNLNDTATSWDLGISTVESILTFTPRFISSLSPPISSSYIFDGRTNEAFFESIIGNGLTCGYVKSDKKSYLVDLNIKNIANQDTSSYIKSSSISKELYNIKGSWDLSLPINNLNSIINSANLCKYVINSGSELSINFNILKTIGLQDSGRLRIYGGIYGNDALIFDSHNELYNEDDFSNIILNAPCGKATIIIDQNYSMYTTVNYGFNLSYSINKEDFLDKDGYGFDCEAYRFSLLPVVIYVDPLLPLYYTLVTLGAIIVFSASFVYIRKRCRMPEFDFTRRFQTYQRVSAQHPVFQPKLDKFRNRFLPIGKCCICQDSCKVLTLECKHLLCLEDVNGYLDTALGDISMFPLKCPMHYEGCNHFLDSKIAKRVMTKPLYERFCEFSDRSMYGDGMRCIFCNNYVTYPESGMKKAMVECPYCVQRFCVRCKAPWHYVSKCPADSTDESLAVWTKTSGAQKCPSCTKLIEKSDSDSCNHMIHKITDGIPCTQDRTDFCYWCGEEVLPDYPHDETRNPGVNHFPEGVFQKCRIMINKDKEEEREKLKKLRRMKTRVNTSTLTRTLSGFLALSGIDTPISPEKHDEDMFNEAIANSLKPQQKLGISNDDIFDQRWDMAMGSRNITTPNNNNANQISPIASPSNIDFSNSNSNSPINTNSDQNSPVDSTRGGGRGGRSGNRGGGRGRQQGGYGRGRNITNNITNNVDAANIRRNTVIGITNNILSPPKR